MRCCRLIVPDMGTVAEAASLRVVAALKRMKLAIRSPKAGCRCQCRKVCACRLLHSRRQRAFTQCIREHEGSRFQIFQMCRRIAHSLPCILETRGIGIARSEEHTSE